MENTVATFRASGLTQEAFCKEHGITLARLRYYLYKKTNVKNVRKAKTRRSNTLPPFISFNKANDPAPEIDYDAYSSLTIIHGKFTSKQLAAFIAELDLIC